MAAHSSFDPLYFNFALEKMPENVIASLYPAYPGSVQYPIEPVSVEPRDLLGARKHWKSFFELADDSRLEPDSGSTDSLATPPSSSNTEANLIISEIWIQIGAIRYAFDSFVDKGSNDWAVSSNLTGGGAILASDPHLSITLPPIWIGFQLVGPGKM